MEFLSFGGGHTLGPGTVPKVMQLLVQIGKELNVN